MLNTDERQKVIMEAMGRGEIPIEINCFPKDKVQILGRTILAVMEKDGYPQYVQLLEYVDACPVCGKLMLVKGILGTQWAAACCKEHVDQVMKEMENLKQQMAQQTFTGQTPMPATHTDIQQTGSQPHNK